MKLPKNVRVKSWIWNIIPWTNRTAQAIYPNIYLSKFDYDSLVSNPSPWHIAHLTHEQEHLKRQKEFGPKKWFLKYIFVPRFRFEEEIAADIPKMKFLKSKKLNPYIDKRAKQLSGWLYFWPVPYKTAKEELERVWEELST
ncbi:MAG TPA: hypothetical protein VKC53_03830 [Patescibacteria group bacterium]|nr:hypothetical protein [Patescibacteria group bacterium]